MTKLKIGLMPFDVADLYGVQFTNKLISLENPAWKTEGDHRVILNINHMRSHYDISPTMTFYRDRLQQLRSLIPFSVIRPPALVIENEELKETHGTVEEYCRQLEVAVEVFWDYHVTNGGLTMPEIAYWYWKETGDDDFFIKNVPANQKDALQAGSYQSTIDKVAYELSVLKSLKIAFVNIHYYLGYAGAVDGWIRMINYLHTVTGKPVMSDEAGIYHYLDETTKIDLLTEVVRIANETSMRFLILYSGSGSEGDFPAKALPISKAQFENLII